MDYGGKQSRWQRAMEANILTQVCIYAHVVYHVSFVLYYINTSFKMELTHKIIIC